MREPVISSVIKFSQKHSLLVMISTVLVTLVFAYFVSQVEINPDIENLIPEDEKFTKLMEKYGLDDEGTDHLILAVESDNPFAAEKLAAFDRAIRELGALPQINPLIHPFSVITFKKRGKKLEIAPIAVGHRAPETEEELTTFKLNLLRDPFTRKIVLSDDGKVLAAIFATGVMKNHEEFVKSLKAILSNLEPHYKVYYTSLVTATYRAKLYLLGDLPKLLLLTALFILVIYYLGFRAKRAVFFPLIVVGFGTIWTIGFMSIFGFPISVVSISTPPLVLILGSSYSIHMLNQYYREIETIPSNNAWIADAVTHVNRTILMAAATTVIGFGSLLATNLKQSRQFGLATSFGIIACAILSLFFLPAILSRLKPPTTVQRNKVQHGFLTRVMGKLSQFVLRWRIPITILLVLVSVGFGVSLPFIKNQSEYINYFPNKDKIVQDTLYITKKLGGFQQINVTLTAPDNEKDYFLQREVLQKIAAFEGKLEKNTNVYQVISFVTYLEYLNFLMTGEDGIPEKRGLILLLSRYIKAISAGANDSSTFRMLANEEFSRLTIMFRVYDSELFHYLYEDNLRELVKQVQADIDSELNPETSPELWGTSLRTLSLSEMVNQNQLKAMIVAVVLIFIITSLSFRSVGFGFLSLVPLAVGIMLNFVFMFVFGIPLDITTVLVSCVTIGVGVDNAIHFLIQYRKQLKAFPDDLSKVISFTLRITGRPILLTTVSIVGGLLILTLASFRPIIYFGLLVSFSLFATAIGTLIILPAILTLMHGLLAKKKGNNTAPQPDGSEYTGPSSLKTEQAKGK